MVNILYIEILPRNTCVWCFVAHIISQQQTEAARDDAASDFLRCQLSPSCSISVALTVKLSHTLICGGKKRAEQRQWSPASSIRLSHRLVLRATGENDESVDRTDPHWHHDIMITGCSGRKQWLTSSHQPLAHLDQEADPWRFRTWFGFGVRTWGFERMWQLPCRQGCH